MYSILGDILGFLFFWSFLETSMVTNCDAAEVKVTLDGKGYQYHWVPYNVKEATSVIFKVKKNGSALIGLFPNETKEFQGQAFYEISIGEPGTSRREWMRSVLRKSGRGIDEISVTCAPCYWSEGEYMSFWVSWLNNIIRFGYGGTVYKQEYWNHKDANPLEINSLAFGSINASVEWLYYDVEPIVPAGPDVCTAELPIPRVPINATVRHVINDGDPKTCLNVTTTYPSVYQQLLIHEHLPLVVKLLLGPLPSCKELMLITNFMWQCPLVEEVQETGMTTCVFNCSYVASTKVLIGFVQSWSRPPFWSLCEVMTSHAPT